MNDVNAAKNITTNDVYDPEMRGDNTFYLLNAANHALFKPHADRQVREDGEFYIPDMLSGEDTDDDIKRHSAASEHAKHLIKAEGLLGEVRSLVEVLIASLSDEVDARAMQAETTLRVIEKKLRKAHHRIDKHDLRHTNLFLAYFDPKDKTDGGEE